MTEPINFTLVKNAPSAGALPQVPCPDFLAEFLGMFETFCVVGCCDWGAIDLSEDQMRRLVGSQGIALSAMRQVLRSMLEWTRQLPGECIVAGSQWYYDPVDSTVQLQGALQLIEKIELGDSP